MDVQVEPILSILAGILILVVSKKLNFIVAIYLILIGLAGLFIGAEQGRRSLNQRFFWSAL